MRRSNLVYPGFSLLINIFFRWTVIRNIPQLQKLDNVNVASEEMAEAMRRGLDLEHPLDGGSSNQSAMLQKPAGGGRSPAPAPTMQEDDRRRGVNRNSYHEQHEQETHNYQTERRESVQVKNIFSRFFATAKSNYHLNH